MKITREVKTGILAVIAIALFVFGYSFLKGNNLLNSDRTFYAVYEDVAGLSSSSPVLINGLQVGAISDISFLNERGDLLVTMSVSNDFQFSKNSTAKIKSGGLIGSKSMTIVLSQKGPLATSGDTLPGRVEKGLIASIGSKLAPLQDKIAGALVSADSLLTGFNQVLDTESTKNLKSTIEDLSKTMASFKNAANNLEQLLANNDEKLNRTFSNLDEMAANFNQLSDTLANLKINRLVANLNGVIADFEEISTKINQGEGTLGKLINDEAVYENLKHATKQLEELLQDIKLNPDRYVHISVFGGGADEYEAPEDPKK